MLDLADCSMAIFKNLGFKNHLNASYNRLILFIFREVSLWGRETCIHVALLGINKNVFLFISTDKHFPSVLL